MRRADKNQGIMYLKCLFFKKLSILYYAVYTGTYVYVHIKKFSLQQWWQIGQ